MNRLTYFEANNIIWDSYKFKTFITRDGWRRCCESKRYFLEIDDKTEDWRIIDKLTNKEVYSYYTDFYNGEN